MLTMHGAAWLLLKTAGPVAERARTYGSIAAVLTIVLYALAGVLLASSIGGYRISSVVDTVGPSNPMLKTVELHAGAWTANYAAHPWTMAAPRSASPVRWVRCWACVLRRPVLALLTSGAGHLPASS
jgi:cytochrome d ubiquinol oxidase subunit II